jgi:steroid delta-isomerase-like uncharacterized protein
MSEHNKTIVRRFLSEVLQKKDLEAADELLAPDFVFNAPFLPEPIRGRDAWKEMMSQFFTAFPDYGERLEEIIGEGDKVAGRVVFSGTQNGPILGIPPTGRRVEIEALNIMRVSGGRIVEQWGQPDMLGMMQQLGLVPAPAQEPVGTR